MSDASTPSSPRADAGRSAGGSGADARILVRRLAEASGQVDAMIEQLGDIAALVRGEQSMTRRPPVPEAPGLRRSTRVVEPVRHDGDRRI